MDDLEFNKTNHILYIYSMLLHGQILKKNELERKGIDMWARSKGDNIMDFQVM